MKVLTNKSLCIIFSTFILFLLLIPSNAFAASKASSIDSGDTAWMLIATAIVIFMTLPGLAIFYCGLMDSKNVVSTVMYTFSSLLVVTIIWVLWGYTLAFGGDVGGIIGNLDYLGFNNVGQTPLNGMTIPHSIFAIFQCAFAAITVAIVSSGVAGRMGIGAWMAFSILWITIVYSPMAHWVWGGGWLFNIGELDFAGGTVVHILSGVSALVAAIILGPRINYLKKVVTPHNLMLFMIGAASLWVGWFGFNAGSALASNGLTAHVFTNTQVAASAAGFSWLLVEWLMHKHPTLIGAANGVLAGLVGITPAAGYVTVLSALVIGLTTSPICYFGIHYIKARFKFDDTLDAFSTHGIGGIWGSLLTGLLATTSVNSSGRNGLLYGNPIQLLHQCVGVTTAIVLAIVGTYIALKTVNLFTSIRVSKEDELNGLDIASHEEVAYTTESNSNLNVSHPLIQNR
ncbi:ammonium transporter [Sporolactobacillus sp. THM7-4]|nr:ammonium transporter [Sporolactobacillus sp. THM7-4]